MFTNLESVDYVDVTGDGKPEAVLDLTSGDASAFNADRWYYVYTVKPGCLLDRIPARVDVRRSISEGGSVFSGLMLGTTVELNPGAVVLKQLVHLPDDPECCPSLEQFDTWQVVDGVLVRVASDRRPAPSH